MVSTGTWLYDTALFAPLSASAHLLWLPQEIASLKPARSSTASRVRSWAWPVLGTWLGIEVSLRSRQYAGSDIQQPWLSMYHLPEDLMMQDAVVATFLAGRKLTSDIPSGPSSVPFQLCPRLLAWPAPASSLRIITTPRPFETTAPQLYLSPYTIRCLQLNLTAQR